MTILLCKRSTNVSLLNKKHCAEQQAQQQQQLLQKQQQQQQHNYETTTNSTSVSPSNLNIDMNSTSNPSQKLLINTTAWLNNSTSNGIITSISGSGSGIGGGAASSAGCNGSIIGIGNCASSFIGSNHSAYGGCSNGGIINGNLSTLNEQQQYQNAYSVSSAGSSIKQLKMQLQGTPLRLLTNDISLNYNIENNNHQLAGDDDDDIYNENNFLNSEFRPMNDNNFNNLNSGDRLLTTSLMTTDGKLNSNDAKFENSYMRQTSMRQMMLQQHTPRKHVNNNNNFSIPNTQIKLQYSNSRQPYTIDNHVSISGNI